MSAYLFFIIGVIYLIIYSFLDFNSFNQKIIISGLCIIISFILWSRNNPNGNKGKLAYKLLRFFLALLLVCMVGLQIYLKIYYPENYHYSIFYPIIDLSLVGYLIFYKPSKTSILKKISKIIGYFLILLGINNFQNASKEIYYITSPSYEIEWRVVLFNVIVVTIGIIFLLIGNKQSSQMKIHDTTLLEERVNNSK